MKEIIEQYLYDTKENLKIEEEAYNNWNAKMAPREYIKGVIEIRKEVIEALTEALQEEK